MTPGIFVPGWWYENMMCLSQMSFWVLSQFSLVSMFHRFDLFIFGDGGVFRSEGFSMPRDMHPDALTWSRPLEPPLVLLNFASQSFFMLRLDGLWPR